MPKQVTTKRKAEGPNHTPKAMPTKKLKKASCQPALNIQPRSASATDSSHSESSPPPSLTSGSSIEDLSSSTSMLQETRPNHGSAQETEDISWDELCAMSCEELQEYVRSLNLNEQPYHVSHIKHDSGSDPYDEEIDAFYEKEIDALKFGGWKWPRHWRTIAMEQSWGQAFIDAHIEE